MANVSWSIWQTGAHASLADRFEGKALAAATARVESYAGVSRLLGPLVGGVT
jgi:hypothetical protein